MSDSRRTLLISEGSRVVLNKDLPAIPQADDGWGTGGEPAVLAGQTGVVASGDDHRVSVRWDNGGSRACRWSDIDELPEEAP